MQENAIGWSRCKYIWTRMKSPARKLKLALFFASTCHLSAVALEVSLHKQRLHSKDDVEENVQAKKTQTLVFCVHTKQ